MNKEQNGNNRKTRRIPFHHEILIDGANSFRSIDISEGGLYVFTGRPFTLGSVVEVTFPVKGGRLTVKAKVKHNQRGVGMGLMFIDLYLAEKEMIKEIIRELTNKNNESIACKKKILLVEKSEMSRRIYKNKLFIEGFSVIEAKDGIEALELIKTEIPDLVILDLYTERIDGFKVLSILKASPEWQHLPVIIWSAQCAQDIVDKAINTGAEKFLSKMVTTPIRLVDAVQTVLKGANNNGNERPLRMV